MSKQFNMPKVQFNPDDIQWIKRQHEKYKPKEDPIPESIQMPNINSNDKITLKEKMTKMQTELNANMPIEKKLKDLIPLNIPSHVIIDKLNLKKFINVIDVKTLTGIYNYIDFVEVNNEMSLVLKPNAYKLTDKNVVLKFNSNSIEDMQLHGINVPSELMSVIIEQISVELFTDIISKMSSFGEKNNMEQRLIKFNWFDKLLYKFNKNHKKIFKIKDSRAIFVKLLSIFNQLRIQNRGNSNNYIVIMNDMSLAHLMMNSNDMASSYNESLKTNSLILEYITSFPAFELYNCTLIKSDEIIVIPMPNDKTLDDKLNLVFKDNIDVFVTEVISHQTYKPDINILNKIYFDLPCIQNKTYTNYYTLKIKNLCQPKLNTLTIV